VTVTSGVATAIGIGPESRRSAVAGKSDFRAWRPDCSVCRTAFAAPVRPVQLWIHYTAFRDLGISTRLTVPPSLSQSATPFIAFWRQDIPHMPLVA
jgi:hypothetical protein